VKKDPKRSNTSVNAPHAMQNSDDDEDVVGGGVRQASILHSKKTGHEAKKGIDKKVH
jgi:hypothetical protein